MGRRPWARCLWPGLSAICRDGSWRALALAVGFALLVNIAIIGSLVWTELFSSGLRSLIWVVVLVIWVGSVVVSRRQQDPDPPSDGVIRSSKPEDDPFPKALEHYLKRNWFDAEKELRRLLIMNPRDGDTLLLLVSLLRRTGRFAEAQLHLARLERLDSGEKWTFEIAREWERLKRKQAEPVPNPGEREVAEEPATPPQAVEAA